MVPPETGIAPGYVFPCELTHTVAAALLSRTTLAKKPEPLPSSAPPKPQQAAVAASEALPAPAIEPPTYEALQDLVAPRGGIAALRAMARAQAMQPRPKPQKPKPVTFQPTDPAIVAKRVALALEALEGIDAQVPKNTICWQRRYANQLAHALGVARRELERAKALAAEGQSQ